MYIVHVCYSVYAHIHACSAEIDKAPSLDMVLMPMRDTPNLELLVGVTARGCSKLLHELLQKWPEQVCTIFCEWSMAQMYCISPKVNAKFRDKTLLHIAAAEGRVNVTRVLLEHKADIRAVVSWLWPLSGHLA